jgi:hypothetical protein
MASCPKPSRGDAGRPADALAEGDAGGLAPLGRATPQKPRPPATLDAQPVEAGADVAGADAQPSQPQVLHLDLQPLPPLRGKHPDEGTRRSRISASSLRRSVVSSCLSVP